MPRRDLLVVTNSDQVTGRGIERIPQLIVDVLSPSTRRHDRGVKMKRYAVLSVPHYWILDPEGKWVESFRLESSSHRHPLTAEGDAQFTAPSGRI